MAESSNVLEGPSQILFSWVSAHGQWNSPAENEVSTTPLHFSLPLPKLIFTLSTGQHFKSQQTKGPQLYSPITSVPRNSVSTRTRYVHSIRAYTQENIFFKNGRGARGCMGKLRSSWVSLLCRVLIPVWSFHHHDSPKASFSHLSNHTESLSMEK